MDILENLVGKSVNEIDNQIIESFESINIKTMLLEYKYKNCGKRYPAAHFELFAIDYNNLISFKDLIFFNKVLILWYFGDIITDLEFFDIRDDIELIKKDYDRIKELIDTNQPHNLRLGDTKLLGAYRLNNEISVNGIKTNKRIFVFKRFYLQKMLNEIQNYSKY